jgi:hypothetical protein
MIFGSLRLSFFLSSLFGISTAPKLLTSLKIKSKGHSPENVGVIIPLNDSYGPNLPFLCLKNRPALCYDVFDLRTPNVKPAYLICVSSKVPKFVSVSM